LAERVVERGIVDRCSPENVLEVDVRPYDAKTPVVCLHGRVSDAETLGEPCGTRESHRSASEKRSDWQFTEGDAPKASGVSRTARAASHPLPFRQRIRPVQPRVQCPQLVGEIGTGVAAAFVGIAPRIRQRHRRFRIEVVEHRDEDRLGR